MAAPQARLTAGLRLTRGDRLADIACGTGGITLEMARRTRPGPVVAVDYSENMLEAARRRLDAEGIPNSLVHAQGERFVDGADPESFDVISCRFALAYVDWRSMLPRIGRLLRPGGRVGILNSTSGSVPQGFKVYEQLRDSPLTAWKLLRHCSHDVGRAWECYRQLRRAFGSTGFITVPDGPDPVATLLERGGLRRREAGTETVRLWFGSGWDFVTWMDESGIGFLKEAFAAGLDGLREEQGVPLDIVVSGVVAERPR